MEKFDWRLRRRNCTRQPEPWLCNRGTRWTRRTGTPSFPVRQVRRISFHWFLHAVQSSVTKIQFQTERGQHKQDLFVVCTSFELMCIYYCLMVVSEWASRQWWMASYSIGFPFSKCRIFTEGKLRLVVKNNKHSTNIHYLHGRMLHFFHWSKDVSCTICFTKHSI